MDALPDIKQLQLETKRLSQGIDKMVNPPMIADVQLKNQPASLLPGGVTYVSGMISQGKTGFAPVYTVDPKVDSHTDAKQIQAVQGRVNARPSIMTSSKVISQFETQFQRYPRPRSRHARRAEADNLCSGLCLNALTTKGFAPIHEQSLRESPRTSRNIAACARRNPRQAP